MSKTFSTILFMALAFGLVGFAYYTDLYYPTTSASRSLSGTSEANLLSPTFDNKNIKEILLRNRMGAYRFVQFSDQWVMVDSDADATDRKLPVKEEIINQLLTFTQRYEVMSEVQNNDINYKTYSFDTPLYSISYSDITDDKYNFRLGVNNTLDNSNYLFHDKADKILRITPLKNRFARLTQEDIVDPKIMNLKEDQIIGLKVRKENGTWNYSYSDLKKINGKWYNSKKQPIETERLDSALQYLSEIKSSLVISEGNFKSVNRKNRSKEASPPILTVEVQHNSKDSFIYKIHQPERNLSSLNINKKKNLIIESSLHQSIFVINRKSLKIFDNLKEHRLKKLNIEKLFY